MPYTIVNPGCTPWRSGIRTLRQALVELDLAERVGGLGGAYIRDETSKQAIDAYQARMRLEEERAERQRRRRGIVW
jgi:hypothetical protein